MPRPSKHTKQNLRQAEKLKSFHKGNHPSRLTESHKLDRLAELAKQNEERVNNGKGTS